MVLCLTGVHLQIRKVDLVLQPLLGADGSPGQGSGAGVIAAIAISCVAAACLLVLAALLVSPVKPEPACKARATDTARPDPRRREDHSPSCLPPRSSSCASARRA